MPTYVLAQCRVKNAEKYRQWLTALLDVIEEFGGRCLAGGGRVSPFQDGMVTERRQPGEFVLLEFQSEVDLRRYRASPEYRYLSQLRQEAADARLYLLEGYRPDNV